jgi:tetrapyrrole methylase family protein/MazG family protein
MVDFQCKSRYGWEDFLEIMRLLRAPGGCPWDAEQTHDSIRREFLEETYEALDAIDHDDPAAMCEELGDILMQVVMHAEIAKKHGEFDISDSTTSICQKMIDRHTHIFGKDRAENPDQVMDLWDRNKMAARGQKTKAEVMRAITRTLPSLLRAVKVLKRAADVHMCETELDEARKNASESVLSVKDEESLGEALLKLTDIARLLKLDPEIALNGAAGRFIDRFDAAEQKSIADGIDLATASPDILRKYWDLVKL